MDTRSNPWSLKQVFPYVVTAVAITGLWWVLSQQPPAQSYLVHAGLLMLIVLSAAVWGLGTGLLATGLGLLGYALPQQTILEPATTAQLQLTLALEGTLISALFGLQKRYLYLKTQHQQLQSRQEHLLESALTDSLTGLLNRRAFEQNFAVDFNVAERNGLPLTLMILDIDGLKQVNDWQGHERGDQLLVEVAKVLKSVLRITDRIYRLGGDEFAVVLPSMCADELKQPVSRLRYQIERLKHKGFYESGISLGLACYPQDAGDRRSLFQMADTRMYWDKRNKHQRSIETPEMWALSD